MNTYTVRLPDIKRKWHIIDAQGENLGKLATTVATLVTGKHKPMFSRHIDVGDFVIIINAAKINLTGTKADKKVYYNHSGRPGGLRTRTFKNVLKARPEEIIQRAINGMLPKNKLRSDRMKKIKVYAGPRHPHKAQMPEEYKIN